MAQFLETLDDLSEQLHAIAQGLRTEIAAQIPLNLEHIASLLVECEKRNLKTLEVEVHLLRLQFLILARKAEMESLPEPQTSVSRVTLLTTTHPETCAKFMDCFNAINGTLEGVTGEVAIHYSPELRDHWRQWGAHEIGHLITCPKSHLFSLSTFPMSCPECGPELDTAVKPPNPVMGTTAKTPGNIDYEAYLCPPEAFMRAVRSVSKSREETAPAAEDVLGLDTEARMELVPETRDVARVGEVDPQEAEVARSSTSEAENVATNGDDGQTGLRYDVETSEKEPGFYQRLLDDPVHLACFLRRIAIS